MKALFLLLAFLPATSFAGTVLEQKNTNGPGWLTQDLTIDANGTVAVQKFQGPGQPLTPPDTIATLPAGQMLQLLAEIAAIPGGGLARLDPHQSFNPGGFGASYVLTRADGSTLEFARHVSGVEYGLAGNAGGDLKALLRKLSQFGQ